MTFNIQEYKQLYLETSQQLINDCSEALNMYMKDTHDHESLAACHRCAHSLKSQSLVMGYAQIGMACRGLELLLRELVLGKQASEAMLNDCVLVIGACREAVECIKNGESEKDLSREINLMQSHIHSLSQS